MLTKEHTDSLLSGNVEHSDKSNNPLMIERDVTKNKKYIGKLNDDSVFLLNYVEINFYDKPMKNIRRNVNMNKYSVNVRNGTV